MTLEFLAPFMPEISQRGLALLGEGQPAGGTLLQRRRWGALPAGAKIAKAEPLIPRKA